ncbi:GBS Bsp-like repeat-containing protein [Paenibacillus sp. FSL L8-0470]|uniref:GBS Bsp-like repeat-containing protein n=1 Tax=Paenibacillus sp. FSL L8-0470 TaxID=2954688 RepID=UPI0030FB39D6
MKKSTIVTMLASVLLTLFSFNAQTSAAVGPEEIVSNYLIVDMNGTPQRQKINIYNHNQLETEILADNSMIRYSYDANGNLLKRNKVTPAEPYIFSTSAVSYDIYLKGVPDSVQNVHFPTWTEDKGQDDIEWIAGVKVAPNLWKGKVILSKHGGQRGKYNTHIYADNQLVKGLNTNIQDTTKIISPQTVSLTDGYYEVYVEGVARTIKEVRFPTWTEYKGQDDIKDPWIIGEKVNDTTWKIRIPFSE